MKPQLLKVPNVQAYSFSIRQDKMTNINNRWHYHPEIELVHFHKGFGTQFVGDHIKRFFPDEIVLVGSKPERIMVLMKILNAIYRSEKFTILSSVGFQNTLLDSENDRIDDIYEFTFNNFHKKIYLDQVAGISGLVPNSFCRYFKSRTGKTYLQFLTEIRVGHACKLLKDDNINIKEVCYESGFLNFSCFHRRFKEITSQSPHNYRLTVAN